ncbi:hypothetical protein EH220_07890 [bacterium]|nr:MAG: hypothetical protein EH220_07890 [bacterium]
MKRLAFFLCAALILAVGFSEVISKTAPRMTVAESRGMRFQHGLHADMDCADCHTNAKTSTSGHDNLFPTHDQCMDCHDVESDNECATCHIGEPDSGPAIFFYSEKFNHAAHADAGVACATCHQNLDGLVTADVMGHFPAMAECMQCHTEKLVTNDCAMCHMPEDELRPRDHKLDWLTLHGAAAAESQNDCAMCHSIANDCQSCHNGDALTNPHPKNYTSRHGQEAHLSDLRCGVCHEQRDFCNECHRAMNVLPAGHYRPDWATASGGVHADEAKFDLESCMACHDTPGTTPVCATCHGE